MQTHTFFVGFWVLLLGALSGCASEADELGPPSQTGIHLARALHQLDLDDLDQALVEVNAARASLAAPDAPQARAVEAVETRIEREREARKTLKAIGTTRATGDVAAAYDLLKTIPRDTLAYDNAYDRHADLPKLIEFSERIAQRIDAPTARTVVARVIQRLRGFDHQIRLQGPLRSPAIVIQPTRFIAGSCNEHIPCKAVSYYKGQPDELAEIPAHDLPQFTATQKHHFFIDLTEVTAGDYHACLDAGRCDPVHALPTTSNPDCNLDLRADTRSAHPMNCISLAGAAQYCAWATGRLPTELEWEVAARGDDGRRFPWGDRIPQCPKRLSHSLVGDCQNPTGTSPIGLYPEGISAAGLLDTAGNVAEWTASGFHSPSASTASQPPSRAVKGGDYTSTITQIRTAHRTEYDPTTRDPKLGFRCAYDL